MQIFIKKFQHLEKEHAQLQQKLTQKENEVILLQEQLKGIQGQMTGALLHEGIDPAQKEKLVHQIDHYNNLAIFLIVVSYHLFHFFY